MKKLSEKFVGYYNYTVILTYLSGAAGIVGVCFAAKGMTFWAFICLFIATLLDAFDGPVARMHKNRREEEKLFGAQIDTLCDIINYVVLTIAIGCSMGLTNWYFIIIYSIYFLCAVIRLSYYTVEEGIRQRNPECGKRTSYTGLPLGAATITVPIVYLVATMFTGGYGSLIEQLIMGAMYLILAFLFVFRFKAPKLTVTGVIISVPVMTAVLIGLFLIRYYVCGVTTF